MLIFTPAIFSSAHHNLQLVALWHINCSYLLALMVATPLARCLRIPPCHSSSWLHHDMPFNILVFIQKCKHQIAPQVFNQTSKPSINKFKSHKMCTDLTIVWTHYVRTVTDVWKLKFDVFYFLPTVDNLRLWHEDLHTYLLLCGLMHGLVVHGCAFMIRAKMLIKVASIKTMCLMVDLTCQSAIRIFQHHYLPRCTVAC